MATGRKFGWHSGTLTCQDIKVKGDLYVQDDIVFSDVSAGILGVTGGIDMTATTSAYGIDMYGGTFATADIRLGATGVISATTAFQISFMNSTYLYSSTTIKDAERAIVSLYCEELGTAINTDSADRTAFMIRARMGSGAASVTTGRNAHALDVLMDCNADYAVATNLRNADIRGARIQAYGHNNVSGVVYGAYINAQLKEGFTFNGQIMEGISSFGAIGCEIRMETSGDGTITLGTAGANVSQAVALAIINRITVGTFTGNVTGIWIEKPYENSDCVSGTTRGIYCQTGGMFASGTATAWDVGIEFADSTVLIGIQLGTCTTGINVPANSVITQLMTIGTSANPMHWDGAASSILVHTENTDLTPGSVTAHKFVLDAAHSAATTSGRLESFRAEVKTYSGFNCTADARAVVGQVTLADSKTYDDNGTADYAGAYGVLGAIYGGLSVTATGNVYPLGSFFYLGAGSSIGGESTMLYMFVLGQTPPESLIRLYNASGSQIDYFLDNPNSAPLGNPGSMPFSDDVVATADGGAVNSDGSIHVRLGTQVYKIPIFT